TRARDSLNSPESWTTRERSCPALEVAWVSSVGEPERTISGASRGGAPTDRAASAAGIHQVSGTRSPAAAARRRLSSFGTEESLNRASVRHGIGECARPGRGLVDHRVVPPAGKDPQRPAVRGFEGLLRPLELARGDHAIPSAPPDLDPLQRGRPRRQIALQ